MERSETETWRVKSRFAARVASSEIVCRNHTNMKYSFDRREPSMWWWGLRRHCLLAGRNLTQTATLGWPLSVIIASIIIFERMLEFCLYCLHLTPCINTDVQNMCSDCVRVRLWLICGHCGQWGTPVLTEQIVHIEQTEDSFECVSPLQVFKDSCMHINTLP